MRRRKKKKSLAPLVLTVAILGIFVWIAAFLLRAPEVVLSEKRSFPVGSTVKLEELILSVEGGTLLDAQREIRADQEGSVTVLYQVRNRIGIDTEYSLILNFYTPPVYDTTAPVITSKEEITVTAGKLGSAPVLDLMEGVSASDDSGEAITVSLTGAYDLEKPGTYTLFYEARDSAGNETKKPLTLKVNFNPFGADGKPVDGTYITPTGRTLVIQNNMALADGQLILNKSYSVPKEYMGGSRALTPETEAAYYQMRNAATAAGVTLTIKSGTRNWNDQHYIFNNYVRAHGLEEALTFSARPGHSEHQTGLAMDLVTSSTQEANEDPTVKAALQWLNDNAYKYGFILRYPEGKSDIHGYIFEPWHYRYVGVELASALYNGGNWITMEEYFGLDSVYRGY